MNKLQWELLYREERISKKEVWLPVVGYEGMYEVSNKGRVRSVKRGNYLKPSNNGIGYLILGLHKKGKTTCKSIHRIVAEAFLKDFYNKPQVNHINGIKKDNRISNLEMVTISENIRHAISLGLMKPNFTLKHPSSGNFGKSHWRSKAINQHDKDGVFIKKFWGSYEASRITGISQQSISGCCNGRNKFAGGYIWNYD